jgi:hypothetical protein
MGSLGRPSSVVRPPQYSATEDGQVLRRVKSRLRYLAAIALTKAAALCDSLSVLDLQASPFWYDRIFVDHVVGMIGFLSPSQSLYTQILFPVDVRHP